MAGNQPFDQLTGPQKVYIAPVGEAVPAVNSTPAGNWFELGATTGDQNRDVGGDITKFYDNDHQGPVKGVVPQEDPMITFTLASLSMANLSRILSDASKIVTAVGPPATAKLPAKRGYIPTEYAVLLRGDTQSDYGVFPGMYVVPRAIVGNTLSTAQGKETRAEIEVELHVLEDDAQAEDDKLGWLIVQTA